MSHINGETIEQQMQRRVRYTAGLISVDALRYIAKDRLNAILYNPVCALARVWQAELNTCLNRLNELERR
jgi:hypothetical protein